MKKLITLFAAVLMAVGANAQTEETLQVKFDNKGWNETSGCIQVVEKISENVQLNLKGQYQAFQIVNSENAFSPSGYKGLKVQYKLGETNTSPINVHVNVGTPNAWDGMYQPLTQGQEEISFDFSSEVLALEKIKSITIQQADNGFANVLIKKIFLIKEDGSEEQLAPFATEGDGLDIPDICESAVLKYRCQYSNVQIVDKDGNSLTYDPTSNTKQIFTIEYAEKPSITLLFLPNMEEKDQWGNHKPYTYAINASSDKKVEITIDNTIDEISGPVVEMRLQANEPETFPAEVKIVKITRKIVSATGIEKVEVLNAANAEFVNAAGQKVGMNYKGLVINKATGKKYINK